MQASKFLTANFGRYDTSSIGSYMNIGGFTALRKAVTMDGEDIAALIAANKVKGRGGAAYDMGRKWSQARDVERAHAKAEKEAIIAEANQLKDSTAWGETSRRFNELMDRWKRAGRVGRSDDDALWAQFRKAADEFFNAPHIGQRKGAKPQAWSLYFGYWHAASPYLLTCLLWSFIPAGVTGFLVVA